MGQSPFLRAAFARVFYTSSGVCLPQENPAENSLERPQVNPAKQPSKGHLGCSVPSCAHEVKRCRVGGCDGSK